MWMCENGGKPEMGVKRSWKYIQPSQSSPISVNTVKIADFTKFNVHHRTGSKAEEFAIHFTQQWRRMQTVILAFHCKPSLKQTFQLFQMSAWRSQLFHMLAKQLLQAYVNNPILNATGIQFQTQNIFGVIKKNVDQHSMEFRKSALLETIFAL